MLALTGCEAGGHARIASPDQVNVNTRIREGMSVKKGAVVPTLNATMNVKPGAVKVDASGRLTIPVEVGEGAVRGELRLDPSLFFYSPLLEVHPGAFQVAPTFNVTVLPGAITMNLNFGGTVNAKKLEEETKP